MGEDATLGHNFGDTERAALPQRAEKKNQPTSEKSTPNSKGLIFLSHLSGVKPNSQTFSQIRPGGGGRAFLGERGARGGSSTNSRSLAVSLTPVTSAIILGPVTGNVLPTSFSPLALNGEDEVPSSSFPPLAFFPEAPGSSGGRGCGAAELPRIHREGERGWMGSAGMNPGLGCRNFNPERPKLEGDQCRVPVGEDKEEVRDFWDFWVVILVLVAWTHTFGAYRFLVCCGKLESPVSH